MFQDPEAQLVLGGVRAELSLPLDHRGVEPAAVARAVEEVALSMGVAHLLDRRTDTLSGGELQRVAIAAALVPRPARLLLDEPTSQLDPVAGDERVALMGRNGAGKSTLLRHLEGLMEPTRGEVGRSGPVALLTQNAGDYLTTRVRRFPGGRGAAEEAAPPACGARGRRHVAGRRPAARPRRWRAGGGARRRARAPVPSPSGLARRCLRRRA